MGPGQLVLGPFVESSDPVRLRWSRVGSSQDAGPLAQLAERRADNAEVGGSSPPRPTSIRRAFHNANRSRWESGKSSRRCSRVLNRADAEALRIWSRAWALCPQMSKGEPFDLTAFLDQGPQVCSEAPRFFRGEGSLDHFAEGRR
jgi:hypothetical protein